MLNGRKQVLLRDEITSQADIMWRMHTNATVTINDPPTSVSLALDGQTMSVSMQNPPAGAAFTKSDAVRLSTDPTPPAADQPNPGVTVLIISVPAAPSGVTLEVLFNPQWPGMSASQFVNPPSVPLGSWTLTSHS